MKTVKVLIVFRWNSSVVGAKINVALDLLNCFWGKKNFIIETKILVASRRANICRIKFGKMIAVVGCLQTMLNFSWNIVIHEAFKIVESSSDSLPERLTELSESEDITTEITTASGATWSNIFSTTIVSASESH